MNLYSQTEITTIVTNLRNVATDTQAIEVKAAFTKFPSSVLPVLSAFANGNGGMLILGLDEQNGFITSPRFNAKAIADALAAACRDKIQPPLQPFISVQPFEGNHIVVATIPAILPADKPAFMRERGLYRGSFVRVHDHNRQLTQYEINRLLEEGVQPKHDLVAVEDATMEDLRPDLVEAVCSREAMLKERMFSQRSQQEMLVQLGALTKGEDGALYPTVAGLLALGVYPQQFFPRLTVTFTHFPGTTKAGGLATGERFLDSRKLAGPIPFLIEETVALVTQNMRIGAKIEGLSRKDLPDYPYLVLREAITNALMHRDYSQMGQGSQVQVNLFIDRLEVLNPGGLYGALALEDLGAVGMSANRNVYLSSLLESVPYPDGGYVAENRGTGYQTMVEVLQRDGFKPPVVDSTLTHFSFTVMRRVSAHDPQPVDQTGQGDFLEDAANVAWSQRKETHARKEDDVPEYRETKPDLLLEGSEQSKPGGTKLSSLSEDVVQPAPRRRRLAVKVRQTNMVELLAEHGELSTAEFAELLGVSASSVRKYVSGLLEDGTIVRTQALNSPTQTYVLADKQMAE